MRKSQSKNCKTIKPQFTMYCTSDFDLVTTVNATLHYNSHVRGYVVPTRVLKALKEELSWSMYVVEESKITTNPTQRRKDCD